MTQKPHWIEKSVGWGLITYRTKILIIKGNLRMQNYDGQFKLNGQEYFYRAKDDSGSSKITRATEKCVKMH